MEGLVLSIEFLASFVDFGVQVLGCICQLRAFFPKLPNIVFSITYSILGFGLVQKREKYVSYVLQRERPGFVEDVIPPSDEVLATLISGFTEFRILVVSLIKVGFQVQVSVWSQIFLSFLEMRLH